MTQFLYANDLKKLFAVYGSFYDLRLPDGQAVSCRNSLEIYRRTHPALLRQNSNYEHCPDAAVVMMNPGSSKPADAGYEMPLYDWAEKNEAYKSAPVILTIPDNAQYQIMRVMEHQGWNHVRVLNLSDLRNPKSSSFMSQVKALSVGYGFFHSIFAQERAAELKLALPEKAVVLVGWGQDKKLLPLAELALAALTGRRLSGVAAKQAGLYHYPSPTLQSGKDAWLTAIKSQLHKGDER